MPNSSSSQKQSWGFSYESTFVSEHILYASIGTLVFVSNSTIVAAWAMKKALRAKKEMVLIVALAMAESTFGLGHMFAAIDRFPHYLRNDLKLVSQLSCFFQPHSIFWTLGALGSATMQLVISVDRYMAICLFTKYMGLGRSYAVKIACCAGAWVLFLFVLFFIDTYINARNEMNLPVCWDNTRFTNHGYKFYWGYLMGTSLIACLTYMVVMCSLKRQSKINVSQTNQQQAQFTYQTRVTKLLSIVTLCTGLLFVAPSAIYFAALFQIFAPVFIWINNNLISLYPLTTGLVCVMTLNSSTNIVIYFVKNVELRHAIMDLWCMSRCKHGITASSVVVTPINAMETSHNREKRSFRRSSDQQKQILPMVKL